MAHACIVSHVRQLFRSEDGSDCVVRFYRAQPQGPPTARDDPAWLCKPITAHSLVLAATSLRFAAPIKGWPSRGVAERAPSVTVAPEHGPAAAEAVASNTKQRRVSWPGHAAVGALPSTPSAGAISPGTATARTPMFLPVPLEGPHELQAAVHVLEYMYTDQLPPAATPLELLQIRKQAQYLLCTACDAPCAAAANAATVSLKDALEVYGMQGALQDSGLTELISNCWAAAVAAVPRLGGSEPGDASDAGVLQVLLARLGSTLETVRSPELQKLWLDLPIEALQLLLRPDSPIEVDCEETVLLLLHRWVEHAPGDRRQHGKQLRSLLRPLDLGPAYLQHVLPKLGWLGLASQDVSDVMYLSHARDRHAAWQVVADNNQSIEAWMPIFKAEPRWFLSRDAAESSGSSSRQECAGSNKKTEPGQQLSTVTIKLEVGRDMLLKELAAFQSTYPPLPQAGSCPDRYVEGSSVYCAGYEWHLQLQLSASQTAIASSQAVAPAVSTSTAPCVPHPASAGGTAAPWTVKGGLFVMCRVPAALQSLGVVTYAPPHSCKVRAAGRDKWAQQALCHRVGLAWGYDAFFMKAGALEVSAWEPYLQDGGTLRAYAEIAFL